MSEDGQGRQRLGRGLSALLGDEGGDLESLDTVQPTRIAPIETLKPNPFQPRRHFAEAELEGLIGSIREKGILQPILVRPDPKNHSGYEIIAGERRWRAAQRARLHEVPIVVREMNDAEALEIALIENIQREDLSPIEEADAYRRLMNEFDHTQEQLAKGLGKSRSHVANMLRLLALPDAVKSMLDDGRLSVGQARPLITRDDAEVLAREIIAKGLNARDVERLVRAQRAGTTPTRKDPQPKDADTLAMERALTNATGLRVVVSHRGDSGGQVNITYRTLEQLDEICRRLLQTSAGERPRDEG